MFAILSTDPKVDFSLLYLLLSTQIHQDNCFQRRPLFLSFAPDQ